MPQASYLFDSAELALAAYANLLGGATDRAENRDPLSDAGFTSTQRAQFATRFPTVVTQYNDPNTSFSATVFADAAGNLTLAIKGTLEFGDFIPSDADMLTGGAAYDQIVAMTNWWLRATSPVGQPVAQYKLAQVAPWAVPADAVVLRSDTEWAYVLQSAPAVNATGELFNALALDPDGRVAVTGHSLGGHLAMAFSTIFPWATNGVTAFDAPGFKDTATNQAFFAMLGGTVPTGAGIVNVIADEALAADSPNNWWAGANSRPGVPVNISIENQWNSDEPAPEYPALNHSMVILADSLAVYKLLGELSPLLTTIDYNITQRGQTRILLAEQAHAVMRPQGV